MNLLRRMLVGVALGAAVVAAEMPPSPLAKPQLTALLATPIFDQDGNLESFHITASFKVVSFNPDGKTLRYQIVPVSFDLQQQGRQSLVIGNSIVEYQDIGNDLLGVSKFVWDLYHPPPLPIRRKVLREVPHPTIQSASATP